MSADSELTHVVIGVEGGGWKSDQLVPVCVLNALLGGGASFSAGGPGKGMYTRLYQNILNRHHFVQARNCEKPRGAASARNLESLRTSLFDLLLP